MSLFYLLLASVAVVIWVRNIQRDLPGLRGACIRAFAEQLLRVAWVAVAVGLAYTLLAGALYIAIELESFTIDGLRRLEEQLNGLANMVQDQVPPAWVFAAVLLILLALSLIPAWGLRSSPSEVIHLPGPRPRLRVRVLFGIFHAVSVVFVGLIRGRRVLGDAAMVMSLVAASTFLTGNSTVLTGLPTAALKKAESGLADIEDELVDKSRRLVAEEVLDIALEGLDPETLSHLEEIYEANAEAHPASVILSRYQNTPVPEALKKAAKRNPGNPGSGAPSGSDRGPGNGRGGGDGSGGGSGQGPSAGKGPGGGLGGQAPEGATPPTGWDIWGKRFGLRDVEERLRLLRLLDTAAAGARDAAVELPGRIRAAAVDSIVGILARPGNISMIRELVADNVVLAALVDSLSAPVQEAARRSVEQAYRALERAVYSDGASAKGFAAAAKRFRAEADLRAPVGQGLAARVSGDVERVRTAVQTSQTRAPTNAPRVGTEPRGGSDGGSGGICTPPLVPCACVGPTTFRFIGCISESQCSGQPC